MKPATARWLIMTGLAGLLTWIGQATAQLASNHGEPAMCRVQGLSMTTPEGWEAATTESPVEGIHSCHTVRLIDGRLRGVLRLVSVDLGGIPNDRPWSVSTVNVEVNLMQALGVSLGEQPLWVKDSMPVRGDGFYEGRAMALSARVDAHPYELNLVLFRSDRAGYVISLLTPPESSNPADYALNHQAFAHLMQKTVRLPSKALEASD